MKIYLSFWHYQILKFKHGVDVKSLQMMVLKVIFIGMDLFILQRESEKAGVEKLSVVVSSFHLERTPLKELNILIMLLAFFDILRALMDRELDDVISMD